MAGFTFAAEIFEYVSSHIHTSVAVNVAAISQIVSMVMGAFFALYAVYFGFQLIFNKADFPLMDGLKQLALLGIVMTFTGAAYYTTSIIPIVLNVGEDIGGAISGVSNSAQSLDNFTTIIFKAVEAIWTNTELSFSDAADGFFSLLLIAVILIGSIPFIATTFGILLTAKIMVGLLLSVGTIFICFAFYPQTRHLFQAWVGLCLNYTLIVILFPVALAIQMDVLNTFLFINIAGTPNIILPDGFGPVLKLAIMLAAFLAISVQIPVLASSLTGGVGINGMSGSFSAMTGGMKSVISPMAGAAQMLAKGGKGGWKLGRKAHNAIQKRRGNNIKAG